MKNKHHSQVKPSIFKGPHHLLLMWLIFTGLLIFSIYVAWNENVLGVLYFSDKSKISYAITLLFIFVSFHSARRIFVISAELNYAKTVEDLIKNNISLKLNLQDDKIHVDKDTILPPCVVTNYIHDLLNSAKHSKESESNDTANTDLIEVYESNLKGQHDIGWFSADVMVKMGLLGTIIGFIYMLGSVANIGDFDVATMQKILRHMSTGMGTALYTTLAGLVCSLLASVQYQMLDRSVDELIETTKHLTRVYVMPRVNIHV